MPQGPGSAGPGQDVPADLLAPAAARVPVARTGERTGEGTGRIGFARIRARGLPAPDLVEFTARCPACGLDCAWTAQREDTRLTVAVDCSCSR